MRSEPIYLRITRDIKEKINTGHLKGGDKIPSENELASKYGVSRMTVRSAITMLIKDGCVYSMAGKGTFVREMNRCEFSVGFNESDPQYVDSTKLIDVTLIEPTVELMFNLSLNVNQKIIKIKRLLKKGESVVGYDEKFIPYAPGIPLVEMEINFMPFQEILKNVVSPYEIEKTFSVSAVEAGEERAFYLGIGSRDPLLLIEQKMFNKENESIGWGKLYVKDSAISLGGVSKNRG